jgi:hypothetical protein
MAKHKKSKLNNEQSVSAHFMKELIEAGLHMTFPSGKDWKTDGFVEWQGKSSVTVRVILEFKYAQDLLKNCFNRNSALSQALYYIKKMEDEGYTLPQVIFVGDEKNSFALKTEEVIHFLNSEVDWKKAPCSPDEKLIDLVSKQDPNLVPMDTMSFDGHRFKEVCEQLATGCVVKVRANENNIVSLFEQWVDKIIPKKVYSAVESVHIFLNCLLYNEADTHQFAYSPSHKNDTIVIEGVDYLIDLAQMRMFFNEHERGGYNRTARESLLSNRDRLIEDLQRRRQGAFYTPMEWVDEAHKLLDSQLGATWREDCIVWDPCAGTGNLTRKYRFKNLILSTAEAPDVQAVKQEKYNAGCELFQYDFLNPNAESPFFEDKNKNRLPLSTEEKLKKAASEGKRLVFLMNPPYAEDGDACMTKGDREKAGVADTLVSRQMPRLGRANRQLYAQFLYQAEQLASQFGFTKKTIAFFSPRNFMISKGFKGFRSYFYERYSYREGFMFQASQFAGVKGSWGVSFTLWSEGKTDKAQVLSMTLKDKQIDQIVDVGMKDMYCSEGVEASEWVKSPTVHNRIDTPKLSSGLSICENTHTAGKSKNALGVFVNKANCPQQNQIVYFLSEKPSDKGTCHTDLKIGDGWRRSISLFSARKLSKVTWVNVNDEYLAPNTQAEGYEQWVDDCHIYALLTIHNQASAMRDVEYKGKKWNIHNHFFWRTHEQALKDFSEYPAIQNDAMNYPIVYDPSWIEDISGRSYPACYGTGDPYFSYELPTLSLSPLAREVLNDLNALYLESIPHRAFLIEQAERHKGDSFHLRSWDAGVYQLKKLWKADGRHYAGGVNTLEAKWEALSKKHKALASQLEHGVYTYGFLKP